LGSHNSILWGKKNKYFIQKIDECNDDTPVIMGREFMHLVKTKYLIILKKGYTRQDII